MSQLQNQSCVDRAIFDFAYNMALRDATMRAASTGVSLDELRQCGKARNVVRRYIDSILEGKPESFYEIEENLEQAFGPLHRGKNKCFTFGNAQKLINMTAKYIYIGAYKDVSRRELFECCHCPMDTIIIQRLINDVLKIRSQCRNALDAETLDLFIDKCARKITRGKRKGQLAWSSPTWSSITLKNCECYKHFQDAVSVCARYHNPKLIPLEYDYVRFGQFSSR
ncbi:hypothetical protein [Adlercreutzia shanghongiae]|uniref:Uncharacterized protein n=1 Tax=Adlercreutzia shanghongiae TaxID=3111773 RepID=A0ABU6J0Q1_9ACTN|nr:hypothetical protein [Adlercreutzia sp. R22]MEC4295665.1 hypothetical protein [Adlercreutzia sp. R22]